MGVASATTKMLVLQGGMGGILLLAAACPGNDDVAASGTGGDDEMPDANPGPHGPSCGERIGRPPVAAPGDLEAVSQAAVVERVVVMSDDEELDDDQPPNSTPGATPEPPTFRATTKGPHIHERWGESRKLELSYCINGMPGLDAENEESYHKTIRVLNSTMAEWERVTGANFIHITADDTPDVQPHVITQGMSSIARADCARGTRAYFGVITNDIREYGISNAVPQKWNDPELEPLHGNLTRTILLSNNMIAGFGDAFVFATLRHELGHMMGFVHEEGNIRRQACQKPDLRPLTPVDARSILTTPECSGVLSDDAEYLTHHDRLSGFFLQHTPRSRFETRGVGRGYRYGGIPGGGAEILWHAEGSTEGVLWRPQIGPGGLSFTEESFPYSSPAPPPVGGWFPNQSEVVIPLQLDASPTTFDLLFYGPGPDVGDLAVFNSGVSTTASSWSMNEFAVPVVGRFDSEDLGRDVVYMYQPGTGDDVGLAASGSAIEVLTDVPQQSAYAYPLAAPYRGSQLPDDILWFDPRDGRVTTWRLGNDGILDLAGLARTTQDALGLSHGENIPAIGDFNGDGRADIMWQGVSNLHASLPDIEDVLWLSQSTVHEIRFAVVTGKDIGHTFRPFVGDFDGDGYDDIYWHRSWGMTSDGPSVTTTGPSYVWYFDETGAHEARAFALDGDYSPYVGDFDGDGCHDIAWLDSVADALHLWRCLPGARDFDCGAAMQAPPDAAPVGMHWGF